MGCIWMASFLKVKTSGSSSLTHWKQYWNGLYETVHLICRLYAWLERRSCCRLLISQPRLHSLMPGSLRWYVPQASALLPPFINVPSEDESIKGQSAQRGWATCFCHTVRMKENKCKQGEAACVRVCGVCVGCVWGYCVGWGQVACRTALAQATLGFITQPQSRLGRGQMFMFTPGQHLTGQA